MVQSERVRRGINEASGVRKAILNGVKLPFER